MTISVVIPAFNAAATIHKAVQSCMQQSFQPAEIIVVTDGCTDDTEKIIRESFPKVRLISLKQNQGPSCARNVGIREAKGNWIAFLDADDEWHPDKLKILAYFIQHQKTATFFYHRFSLALFEKYNYPPLNPLLPVRFSRLLLRNSAQASCLCIRRDSHAFFNESFRYCEDHEMVVRLAWQGEGYVLPYVLTRRNRAVMTSGGLSEHRWAMRRGELKMYLGLWRLHWLFVLLIPFLLLFSMGKHLRAMITKK